MAAVVACGHATVVEGGDRAAELVGVGVGRVGRQRGAQHGRVADRGDDRTLERDVAEVGHLAVLDDRQDDAIGGGVRRQDPPGGPGCAAGITILAERRALVEGPVVPAARGCAGGLIGGRAVPDEVGAFRRGEDVRRPVGRDRNRRDADLVAAGGEGAAVQAGRPGGVLAERECGGGGQQCAAPVQAPLVLGADITLELHEGGCGRERNVKRNDCDIAQR